MWKFHNQTGDKKWKKKINIILNIEYKQPEIISIEETIIEFRKLVEKK